MDAPDAMHAADALADAVAVWNEYRTYENEGAVIHAQREYVKLRSRATTGWAACHGIPAQA